MPDRKEISIRQERNKERAEADLMSSLAKGECSAEEKGWLPAEKAEAILEVK